MNYWEPVTNSVHVSDIQSKKKWRRVRVRVYVCVCVCLYFREGILATLSCVYLSGHFARGSRNAKLLGSIVCVCVIACAFLLNVCVQYYDCRSAVTLPTFVQSIQGLTLKLRNGTVLGLVEGLVNHAGNTSICRQKI